MVMLVQRDGQSMRRTVKICRLWEDGSHQTRKKVSGSCDRFLPLTFSHVASDSCILCFAGVSTAGACFMFSNRSFLLLGLLPFHHALPPIFVPSIDRRLGALPHQRKPSQLRSFTRSLLYFWPPHGVSLLSAPNTDASIPLLLSSILGGSSPSVPSTQTLRLHASHHLSLTTAIEQGTRFRQGGRFWHSTSSLHCVQAKAGADSGSYPKRHSREPPAAVVSDLSRRL